ncbi:MAG: outer membrane beta-barrel protein, partial [Ginsengibacter sp.]
MDKNLHKIEDLFRKALEDNEENPSQNAWDGIEKKLDKDNVINIKRKYDLLKKVALLLVFLLAGLSIYVWKFQVKNPVKPKKDISEINYEAESKNDTLTQESGTTNLQKPIDSLTIGKSDNSKQITESVSLNLQKQDDTLSLSKINILKQVAKDSHKIIEKPILKEENVSPKKHLNPITSKDLSNTSIKKNNSKFINPDESRLQDDSRFPIQKKGKLIKRNSGEVVETKTPMQIDDKRPTVVNPSGIQFGNNLPVIEILNSKNVGNIKSNSADSFATKELLQNIALARINPLIQIEKSIVHKPSIKSTSQSRFAISAFYSPDIAFYHFENKNPGNSNNNFENLETESYSSTLGVLVDFEISKHWGLQSGITLATSNFDQESKTLYAQPDNSGGIKYKLNTLLGDAYVLPSFSRNPNIGDSIYSKSTTHTLQYLEIPLALKYYFNRGKFTLNTLGGISANFLTGGRITTELKRGNDNETETTNKIHGLKSTYFSGLAGIGLDYNFYKNLSVSFSPTIRFAL